MIYVIMFKFKHHDDKVWYSYKDCGTSEWKDGEQAQKLRDTLSDIHSANRVYKVWEFPEEKNLEVVNE